MISVNQLEFQASATGRTQNERVLARLQACVGEWVPMPDLAKCCSPTGIGAAVHSRVNDLRKAGWPIDQKNERRDGQVHSFYKLNGSMPHPQ